MKFAIATPFARALIEKLGSEWVCTLLHLFPDETLLAAFTLDKASTGTISPVGLIFEQRTRA